MMKYDKVWLVLVCLALLAVPAAAAPPFSNVITSTTSGLQVFSNEIDSLPVNRAHNWEIHVLNGSTQMLYSDVTCMLHIYIISGRNDTEVGGDHIFKQINSTFQPGEYDIEFQVPASVHSDVGSYEARVFCNTSNLVGASSQFYYVTVFGKEPAGELGLLWVHILFLVVTLLLFYTLFITIAKLVTLDEGLYDVLLAWAGLLILLYVIYFAKNYMLDTYILDMSNFILDITIWSNGVLPPTAFVITFLFKMFQKEQVLNVNEINGRLR